MHACVCVCVCVSCVRACKKSGCRPLNQPQLPGIRGRVGATRRADRCGVIVACEKSPNQQAAAHRALSGRKLTRVACRDGRVLVPTHCARKHCAAEGGHGGCRRSCSPMHQTNLQSLSAGQPGGAIKKTVVRLNYWWGHHVQQELA